MVNLIETATPKTADRKNTEDNPRLKPPRSADRAKKSLVNDLNSGKTG
jgi:hypothetical protein